MLAPTAGRASVGGYEVTAAAEQVRRLVGYAAQGTGVDIDLTVRENLVLRARLHGLLRPSARGRTEEMLGRLDLEGLASRRAGLLSGGQRRRLDLALALVHQPPLVVLDEPTTGLDPQARRSLWDEIDSLSRSGTTVVLTTQHMEEADRLCARVGIIDGGRMVAEGTPAALKAEAGGEIVTLDLASTSTGDVDRVERLLRDVPGAGVPVVVGNSVSAPVADPVRTVAAVLAALAAVDIDVRGLRVGPPSLEDVYLHHTGLHVRPDSEPRAAATALGVAIGAHGGSR
jgi:ABC-2 type transport system ATP-binding protein